MRVKLAELAWADLRNIVRVNMINTNKLIRNVYHFGLIKQIIKVQHQVIYNCVKPKSRLHSNLISG